MKHKVVFYIFLVTLVLPVLSFPVIKDYIDSENHENRKYAEMPVLSMETLETFPKDFDTYFNDHLPYKNQLVMINTMRNQLLGVGTTAIEYKSSSNVIRGKNNWLFYNAFNEAEDSIDDYMCTNPYSDIQLQEITQYYVNLQQALEERGTELVVLYAANKEQVYPEYMPSTIIPSGSVSRTDQLVDYINENTTVPVIYTKDALLKEKENYQVFLKYDTHWNNLGGFVGGQLLNEYFHGEYVSLDKVKASVAQDNMTGDLANLLSLGMILNDDKDWQVDNYKTDVIVQQVDDGSIDGYYEFSSNAEDERSVLFLMDSFGYAMMGEVPKDFQSVTFLTTTENFKKYCDEIQPDILVVEIVERQRAKQERLCEELYKRLNM